MQKLSDTTLKKSLTDGVMRLYLVAGNDAFIADNCVSAIVKSAMSHSRDGALRFEQKRIADGGFEELFYAQSLLGQSQVAIVGDFDLKSLDAGSRKLVEELFNDIPRDVTVILKQVVDDKRFAISKNTLDFISSVESSAVVSVNFKTGAELERYITAIAKRENCEIETAAIRQLVILCGDDLMLISNEIKKLAALADYSAITIEHVKALGIRTAEVGVYEMISAIESKNVSRAVTVLKTMLDDLNEPLAITAALNAAFINLYRARLVRDSGRTINYLIEEFGYKKGDRKVSIAFDRCSSYTVDKLEKIIAMLYILDAKLKSSAVDQRYVIEHKITEIASMVAS